MTKSLISFFLVLSFTLGSEASFRCQAVHREKTGIEIFESINQDSNSLFFKNSINEQILAKSFPGIRAIKTFRLKRTLKSLQKDGESFDAYDLDTFAFRLEKLAFSDLMDSEGNIQNAKELGLSKSDLFVLSETRRVLLKEGIARYFSLNQYAAPKSKLKKAYDTFMNVFSWKYWRWANSALVMPKLMNTALPLELAKKIAWEGLEKNRAEVEKHLPAIKTRSGFNTFSKGYNYLVLTSFLTVVPYFAHAYYSEQIQVGEQKAQEMLQPLVKTTEEMSKIDYAEQIENDAFETFSIAFQEKYKRPLTEEEAALAKQKIHNRLSKSIPKGDSL